MSKCQQPVGLSLMALSINTGYIMPSAPAKQFFVISHQVYYIFLAFFFSALTLLVGWQEGYPA